MRPHFFKGYSKSQKRILTPEELTYSGVYLGVDGRLAHAQDIVLLAFTGRQDIHGKPIFEMDVVDADQKMPLEEAEGRITYMAERTRCVVKWAEDAGFWIMEDVKKPASPHDGYDFLMENVVVIGNALVTPKLLELPPLYAVHTLEGQSKPTQA